MKFQRVSRPALGATFLASLVAGTAPASAAPYLVSGIDTKLTFDAQGKQVRTAPGDDVVSIIDIGSDPTNPTVVASLPLINSLMGPPTNLAITPDEKLALVANSVQWNADGESWKADPDTKIHLVDLEASPPVAIGSVDVGQQPSGMAVSAKGDLALVANRAGKSISVLAIEGKAVRHVGDVDMGEQVAAVAISPDGTRALAVKFGGHKATLLSIDGQTVTAGADIPTGLWPYNVAITPDGRLGLTADNGAMGASDGHVDTVTVIDLGADPPRAIDRVAVGDGPEGLAISPKGDLAVAVLLNGSWGVPDDAWFANPTSRLALLKIDGDKVTKVGEVEVGAFAEGAAFSPDGSHLYIGNYRDGDLSILTVDGTTVTDTGKRLALPGLPASLRGSLP